MKNQIIRQELLLIALAVIPILYLVTNWSLLPEQMPIHFDMNGKPNGFGSKFIFIFLPLGIYFLMLVLPFIDPRKGNYEIFGNTYFKLRIILGLFFGIINSAIIYNVLHHIEKMGLFVPIPVFLLFTLIGNYMGTIRQNYFIGIKVPWTLNNEEVWTKTHKMAGRLWFWSGLAGVALLFFVKDPIFVMIPVILIIIVVPVIYSYIIYQKITK